MALVPSKHLVAALQRFDANGRDLTQTTAPTVSTHTVADLSKGNAQLG